MRQRLEAPALFIRTKGEQRTGDALRVGDMDRRQASRIVSPAARVDLDELQLANGNSSFATGSATSGFSTLV
jgi:hypothetical protein